MAIQTIKVSFDNMSFSIQQFKFFEAIDIEAQTLQILAPGLNLLENFKGLDQEFDLSSLGQSVQKILSSLRSESASEYIKKMLKNTFCTSQDKPILLNSDENINTVFHGKTLSCMKLLFEIMKVNKFAFIEGLVGRGLNIIDISKNMNTKQNRKS